MPIQHRFESIEIAEPLAAAVARHAPRGGNVNVSDFAFAHSSGMSNETVFFTARWHDGRTERLVARIPAPNGEGLFLGADVATEHALMTVLARETQVPVPEPVFFEPDTAVIGAPFMVLPFVAGRSPADDPPYTAAGWLADATAEDRAAVNDAAIRALVDLHAVDPDAPPFLAALPAGRDTFSARLDHAERWLRWGFGDDRHPVADSALDWLRANQPASETPHVITWGDARISNMVFSDAHDVLALVDWELAARGPRERDLGWWLFAHRHHTDGIGVPQPDGFPSRAALVARYEELSGHTCADLDVYEVLGGLEAALIMVRVARQMIDAQMLPPDSTMAVHNPATVLLGRLIGLPEVGGEAVSFIGNRG
jgi:aminoglycoside phosphotransferase (APT) family kinase protein